MARVVVESSDLQVEQWSNTENHYQEVWSRTTDGRFYPSTVGANVLPADMAYSPCTLALLAAKCCPASKESHCLHHVLSGQFDFCPGCCSALETLSPVISPTFSHWLMPMGMVSCVDPIGHSALYTQQRVVLSQVDQAELDAPMRLPVPISGEYRFLVANFGFHDRRLLAVDVKTHTIFVLDPEHNHWHRMQDHDGLLMDSALPAEVWGMAVVHPLYSDRCYFCCLNGVVEVRINLFTQTFSSRVLVAGLAKSAPIIKGNTLYLLLERSDGLQIFHYDLLAAKVSGELVPCAENPCPEPYFSAVHDDHEIVWLSKNHQLRAHFAGDQPTCSILSWGIGLEPVPEFGPSVFFHHRYWQLCFDNLQDAYCYVRVGADNSTERHITPSPRISTGLTHFQDAKNFQRGEPWFVCSHSNDSGQMMLPIMEFGGNRQERITGTPSVLSVRLDSTDPLLEVLHKSHRIRCEAVLLGEPDQLLVRLNISRPWTIQCFLYDGCLWLYHKELSQISGWGVVPC